MKVTEVHRRLQKVFQEFQKKRKSLNCKHSRLGGTELSEQKAIQNAFKNFKVGGSDLSATTPR